MGTFFNKLISSAEALVTPTPTLILLPEVFASVIPITTVDVEEGTTYTPAVATPTFAFDFNLKVFAIVYPSAIASAVASSADMPPLTETPLILTSVELFITPSTSSV